jgi:uncharacterized SAM-binding protein YcdF (DUF218 family)
MFVLSKIFWLVLNPENLFTFFVICGSILLFTRFRRTGRWFVSGASVFIVLVGIFPVGSWMIENLENRFPANPEIPEDIDGIVALGGTISSHLTASRKQPALGGGGERLTELVYLARRYPNARLIFSGGSGALIDDSLKEADAARLFFERMGLPKNRITYERQSRNTLENALFSMQLAGDSARTGKWVLVTSASHMPRAMGVFRKAGWNIQAFPVDYDTDGQRHFRLGFHPLSGLAKLNTASREWIGLLAYRILGRTSAIAPSAENLSDN